jgi:hypothetical protein
MKAYGRSRGTSAFVFNLGRRWRFVVNNLGRLTPEDI